MGRARIIRTVSGLAEQKRYGHFPPIAARHRRGRPLDLRAMKTLRLIPGALFFLLMAFGHAAEEIAPQGINAHYAWCGEAKTAAAKLKRYEAFWQERHPQNEDEYDDQPHITFVRRAAYRLAELYALTGQAAKCREKIRWLEKNDDSLR
jgi:hypothetical protein